jgi:hypothetical protein
MKTEKYTCDVCGNVTRVEHIFDAQLKVQRFDTLNFHVCRICYGETPKGVFQKAFNALWRRLRGGK